MLVLCEVPFCPKDFSYMMWFCSEHFWFGANYSVPIGLCVNDVFDCYAVVTVTLQALISVLASCTLMDKVLLCSVLMTVAKKGMEPWVFYCELVCLVYGAIVLQEVLFVFCLLYEKCNLIYIHL